MVTYSEMKSNLFLVNSQFTDGCNICLRESLVLEGLLVILDQEDLR